MTKNIDIIPGETEFALGGIEWTVIQSDGERVKCIASDVIEYRAFDKQNRNNFALSQIRDYLNGEFFYGLVKAGAPEEIFDVFPLDLTTDDGLRDYGIDNVRIGLITCDEYRALRLYIPRIDKWWWTATADSPTNSYVRCVYTDGSLNNSNAYAGYFGVRPLCVLKSEILESYLDDTKETEAK
jgi:hypothetical protein